MFDHKVVALGSKNATILSWLASIGITNVASYLQDVINRYDERGQRCAREY